MPDGVELIVTSSPNIPVMYYRKFADMFGLEHNVVRGMLDKGHLPSMTLGRYRCVNLALLNARCLKYED